ncbi:MAG: CRISPR-associated endonuclease Cas2 [Candidatus Firestonebacteria bacterium]|nr:CRISPR-associated endonuclease Cas2 [Candidatus Firestonebacteria bacterium]
MLFIICYDISNTKRRNKMVKTLLDYGDRIQYSVFKCNLDKKKFIKMRQELIEIIQPKNDSLIIFELCKNCFCNIECYGYTDISTLKKTII